MVVLYIFGDIYPNREYCLKKTSVKNQTLNIYFQLEDTDGKDATMPYQRCLMVKLDKSDITEVNFIEE